MVQIAIVAVALAVIVGGVYATGSRPASSPGSAVGTTQATVPSLGRASPVDTASTSSRGVTRSSISVVFPVVSLNSLAGQVGFAQDAEFGEQRKAITLFVEQINATGGINGRKINPIIVNFDPTSEASMRALCKQWTEGSPAAFAVLDGLGDWTGDNELCITQEGHTPFIGAWTTVTNWIDQGSPYLWWTGTDQAVVLQAVVDWGLGAGLVGRGVKVGIIAGNRASDQAALDDYLLPDLRKAGITPVVRSIDASPDDTATTDSEAPLVVQQLHNAGVTSVIPLCPFNVFLPVLQAETTQHYFPKLLLSDYEGSIEAGLGVLTLYAKALNGQDGLTTETLGGIDSPRPQSQGGYDPGLRSCWVLWHKTYPEIPPGNMNDLIEEQGPIAGWCQVINLFATAARRAGPDLDRRTFVTAMSEITDFPGTWSTVLSFGPDKRYGPTKYQVVKLRVNSPPSPLCKTTPGKPPPGTCWVSVRPYAPLPTG
ncbi:MAG TPA: ABC transporter substrate-binding protein [Acidimicrobiales bacterium]